MAILRYLILFAIAAAGIGLIVGSFLDFEFRLQGWVGFAVCAVALAATALVLRAIGSGRLPLKTWYVLPLILGGAATVLANEHAVYSFVNLAPGMIGLGTVLISFSALQLWADRQGGGDWTGVIILLVILVAGSLPGQIAWLAR